MRDAKTKAAQARLLNISETVFLEQVLGLARALGWRSAHFRPGLTQSGKWRTAVQGDGKGFPDLVLAHEGQRRCIVAELKDRYGKCSPEQKVWLAVFREIPGVEVYLWRPNDYDEVERILRGQ